MLEKNLYQLVQKCCGAGGGLRSYDLDLLRKIAADCVRTADNEGPDIIATTCRFCEHNLIDGVEIAGSSARIVDVVDLVAESLEKQQYG